METWKDIPNYVGLYEASTCGRIRTKKGKTTSSARFEKRVWKQRILKQKIKKAKHGRKDPMVTLWKDGKPYYHLVSRLIAATFHGDNLKTKLTVNHIDGNPMNNNADNLEWLTVSENIKYGFRNGQFDSIEKEITIISEDGIVITAKSMAGMDRFLNRYSGYTSRALIIGKLMLYDNNGKAYCVKTG